MTGGVKTGSFLPPTRTVYKLQIAGSNYKRAPAAKKGCLFRQPPDYELLIPMAYAAC
jgi:hypothetical protein